MTNEEALKEATNRTGLNVVGMVPHYIVGFIDPDTEQLVDFAFHNHADAKQYRAWLIGALACRHFNIEPVPQDQRSLTAAQWLELAQQLAKESKVSTQTHKQLAAQARDEFVALEQSEPILQFFAYAHLPDHLQEVSKPFGELALSIVKVLPRNPERTVALRKLLEGKDAAVRAKLYKVIEAKS